jgi:hypothetical protein
LKGTPKGYHPTFEGNLKEAKKKNPPKYQRVIFLMVPKGRLELPITV